jgi:hypothetical protein
MRCRLQGRGIYRRPAGGRTRQPAPYVRRRNRRTGPVRGVAAGHEETESRFLGRAQAVVWRLVARGALPRNDRLGSAACEFRECYAPGLVKQLLSFRGPATLQPDECVAGCRAEESTVGLLEAGRGSPRRSCGGETVGWGQSGVARQATRKRRVDSSVARKRLCAFWLHVVRSLGMTDWGVRRVNSGGLRTRLGEAASVIPRPGHTAPGRMPCRLQGRGIYRRPAGGRTRQPA